MSPSPLDKIATSAFTARTLYGAGVIVATRPSTLLKMGMTLLRWGATPAAGYAAAAERYGDEPAIIDDLGTLTFADVNERTNRLANAFADEGIGEGDNVAMMCRNHRGFIEATVALSKLGANALYLNTSFAGPQAAEVVKREKAVALIYDEEFADLLHDAGHRRKRFVGWYDGEGGTPDDRSLEALIESGDPSAPVPPAEHGKTTILTSGTTGTPKGASRSGPDSLDPVAAMLSKIPLKARETTHIAAPLFHSWGFAHWSLGLALSSTIVLTRRFDPETTLSLTAQHEATALVVVPVMLQRILELPVRPSSATTRRSSGRSRPAARPCPASWPRRSWTSSGTSSTTSTARPRWPGRPSPRRRTSAPRPAPRAARRAGRS